MHQRRHKLSLLTGVWFCRILCCPQIVRHRDHGEQEREHHQQHDQLPAFAFPGLRAPAEPCQQCGGAYGNPDEIEDQFHIIPMRLRRYYAPFHERMLLIDLAEE